MPNLRSVPIPAEVEPSRFRSEVDGIPIASAAAMPPQLTGALRELGLRCRDGSATVALAATLADLLQPELHTVPRRLATLSGG